MMLLSQRHIVPPSVVKKAIFRCRNKLINWIALGPRMTLRNDPDRHSDYDPPSHGAVRRGRGRTFGVRVEPWSTSGGLQSLRNFIFGCCEVAKSIEVKQSQ
jgi:hypothetical protein